MACEKYLEFYHKRYLDGFLESIGFNGGLFGK